MKGHGKPKHMYKHGGKVHGKHPHHHLGKRARGGRTDGGAMATTSKPGKQRPGFAEGHTDASDDE